MTQTDKTTTDPRIDVDVEVEYLQAQSEPESDNYAFAYRITVTNHRDKAVQLLSRHWLIIDSNQRQREVSGVGVVGEQPFIAPGASYTYTSGAVIDTPIGTMQGSYQLVDSDGASFEAEIKPFLLATPHQVN